MQGLATLPDAFNKAQFDAGQAQESRLKTKKLQMEIAKNQWDQGVSMLQKNPRLASNAAFKRQFMENGVTLGYQVPTLQDGSLDPAIYGTTFDEHMKDKAFSDTWNSATPAQRHQLAAERNIVGIPESAFNIDPIYSPKETQLLGQLKLNEVMGADRRRNLDARTKAQDDRDYGQLAHWAKVDQTNQQNANTRLIDVKQKVHIAQIRADSVVAAAKARATVSDKQWQYTVHAAEQGSQQAHAALNEAVKLRDTYAAGGVDADDPVLANMNAEVKAAQDAVTTADERRTTAVESTPSTNDIHGNRITKQSGATSATVQNAAPQKPYIVQPGTGTVFYLWPDQKYHPTPPP